MISVKVGVKFLYSVIGRKPFVAATLQLWLVDSRENISSSNESWHFKWLG